MRLPRSGGCICRKPVIRQKCARSEFPRNPQTARSRRDREVPESFVTVTHPFHPLSGQRLRVLFERKTPDGLAVSCEGRPLGSVMVPLAWAERAPAEAAGPLTYEVLAYLAAAVPAVRTRQA